MAKVESSGAQSDLGQLWQLEHFALQESDDMFLQLVPKRSNTPVNGEGRALGDWKTPIQIAGWSWAEGRDADQAAGQNLSIADMRVTDLSIVKPVDSASPVIAKLCAQGEVLASATIKCLRAGGQDNGGQVEYLSIALEESLVRNFQVYTSSRFNRPMEVFQLSAQKLQITYAPQKQTGSRGAEISFNLDIAKRKVS